MAHLKRELSLFSAVMMGLGSIIGTGVFLSIGIAAGITGPSVILAIVMAAFVALCNALSSAQLAASHPQSGGTYEYGYRYLSPAFGFIAGWMFLCAKTASAATAALGFSTYLLNSLPLTASTPLLGGIAVITVCIVTGLVLTGMQRSNQINIAIVSVSILALLSFIVAGIPSIIDMKNLPLSPFFKADKTGLGAIPNLLHATALMFVAYTGYGRIATLGEEVKKPQITIPRAIKLTLLITAVLYTGVALVALLSVGATGLSSAPLPVIARHFHTPPIHYILAIGAMSAMLGVLLNLILGLSRTVLAMGRRGDLPKALSRLNSAHTTPYLAVIAVGLAIIGLTFIQDIRLTWSFSAFTVLIYYSITNLAALRLPKDKQLYSPTFAWLGLAACLCLAFWVAPSIWISCLGLMCLGLLWQRFFNA